MKDAADSLDLLQTYLSDALSSKRLQQHVEHVEHFWLRSGRRQSSKSYYAASKIQITKRDHIYDIRKVLARSTS
jgi:hypothetical protein